MNKAQRTTTYWTLIHDIHQASGLKGFYVGLLATYVKVFPSTAIFVLTYENVKAIKNIH